MVRDRRAGGDFQVAPLARLFGLAIFGGGSGKIGLAFLQIVDLLLVVGLDFTPSGDFVDLALDGKFLGLDVVVELLGGPFRNRFRTIDAAVADRVAAFGKQHEDQTDGHHRPPGQEREAAEIRSQVGGDFPAFRSARRGRRLGPAAVGNDERLVARRALDPLPQMGVADLESMAFRTGRFVGHSKTPRTAKVGEYLSLFQLGPSAIRASMRHSRNSPRHDVRRSSADCLAIIRGVLVRWPADSDKIIIMSPAQLTPRPILPLLPQVLRPKC